MTGAAIITAILADSFESSRRAEALTWANDALGSIWDADEWSFRFASEPVKVTANSNAVTEVSSSFGTALAMYRADGTELAPIEEYRDYAELYLGTANTAAGLPEAFCVVGTDIFVGPTSSQTSTAYLLVYEKTVTLLADNGTECALPAEAHLGVVFGGKANGYLLTNVDRAAAMDARVARTVESLRRSYLRSARGTATQAPAYRPGG